MSTSELQLTRIVPAPVEDVYRAWTDPAVLAQWWGRASQVVRSAEADARMGGAYRIEVVNDEGAVYVIAGEYTDVDPPHRLAFTWRFEVGGPGPQESHVSVELRPAGAETELVLTHGGFPDVPAAAPYRSGWEDALAKLVGLFG
ncbi:MAG: SRPBCC domain-containing protein [Solirubrobacteraceae bacterium]